MCALKLGRDFFFYPCKGRESEVMTLIFSIAFKAHSLDLGLYFLTFTQKIKETEH